MLADRIDIEEELARLEIHTGQLLEMLTERRRGRQALDFLLQEMNRETNTSFEDPGIGEPGLTMTRSCAGRPKRISRRSGSKR